CTCRSQLPVRSFPNSFSMYSGAMMLSMAKNRNQLYRRERVSSCSITFSTLLERYSMPERFSPQKVQWFFSPHQQPRDVSIGSINSRACSQDVYPHWLRAQKYSSKSGT